MMKICIWMNIPSHHQHFFFEALNARKDTELAVRYYDSILLERRRAQGWIVPELEPYAAFAGVETIAAPELRDHIHIIPTFDRDRGERLSALAVQHGLKWCHWGEFVGIKLAKMLDFNEFLFSLLNDPLNRIRLHRRIVRIRDHASYALAQGKIAADELEAWGIGKEKIRHLSYSVPALPSEPRSAEAEAFIGGRTAFLCVATLYKLKGIIWLLRAYAGLTAEERSRCCLVFLGGGDAEPYKAFCRSHGIVDGVCFMGSRSSDQIAGIYNSCDCLVHPTLCDGWGVVLNEAASVGMPLISTRACGAAWHLIDEGKNGFRVPIKDPAALRNAMRFYLADGHRIAEHGAESMKIFSRYTPDIMAERLCGYLGKSIK